MFSSSPSFGSRKPSEGHEPPEPNSKPLEHSRKSSITGSTISNTNTITRSASNSTVPTPNQETFEPPVINVAAMQSPQRLIMEESDEKQPSSTHRNIKYSIRKTASHLFLRSKLENQDANPSSNDSRKPSGFLSGNDSSQNNHYLLPSSESATLGEDNEDSVTGLPEHYKGFHAPETLISTVPPFKSPVKPSYKKIAQGRKKGSSLLNKFINSRKSSESSGESQEDQQNQQLIIIPPLSEGFLNPAQKSPITPNFDSHDIAKGRQNSNSSSNSNTPRTHHPRKGIFNLYSSSRLKSISSERSNSSVSGSSDQNNSIQTDSNTHESSKQPSLFEFPLLDNDFTGIINSDFANSSSFRTSVSSPRGPRGSSGFNGRSGSVVSNFLDPTGSKSHRNQSLSASTKWVAPESWAVKHDVSKMKKNDHDSRIDSLAPPFSMNVDPNDKNYTPDSGSPFNMKESPYSLAGSSLSPNRLDDTPDPLSTENVQVPYYNQVKDRTNDNVSFKNYVIKSKSDSANGTSSDNIYEQPVVVNQYPIYTRKDDILPDVIEKLRKMEGVFNLKIYSGDETFKTIRASIDDTVADLLVLCKKKFFLPTAVNYQIVFKLGTTSKVLEPEDKPLILLGFMLLLAGYDEKNDNFSKLVTREDISYLCKFILEENDIHMVRREEERFKSHKNYSVVDLQNLDLHAIPISFFQHTYNIVYLDVSRNPSILLPEDFISSCNNLEVLKFTNNHAIRFPRSLLEARKLVELDLQNNLIPALPNRLGILVHLKTLQLSCNNISMLPDDIAKLQNLKTLNLASNNLTEFPQPVTKLPELQRLDLSFNKIEFIPKNVTKLQSLEVFNMATNKLTGILPDYLADLASVKEFNIQYNKLANFDSAGLMKSLEKLYATSNNVSRFQIQAKKLKEFYFDRNPIVEIPLNDVSLDSLTKLNLSKAKLTALTDKDLSRFINIETLILDKNDLTYLPQNLGCSKKLTYLSAYSNNLNSIPTSIGELHDLKFLDLHSNNIKNVPDSIWNCGLLTLNLSSNLLQYFPSHPKSNKSSLSSSRIESRKASAISTFTKDGSASENDSSSSVAREISDFPFRERFNSIVPMSYSSPMFILSDLAKSLQNLSIADNRLADDSLESISVLGGLKVLNMSYNELTEIPPGILRRFSQLKELYLSGNQLGNIPGEDFATLKALNTLHLNNNKIHSLPHDLSKLKGLTVFDVGSNQLKYNISNYQYDWNWQWNLGLKYLNFSGNKRLEISRQFTHSKAEETFRFDSFIELKQLKVLGLIDVTLKNSDSSLPDESINTRVRTTASEIYSYKYGVADTLGKRNNLSTREIMYSNFRGQEDECLVCLFDGKNDYEITERYGNKITLLIQEKFKNNFTEELRKKTDDETIENCLRKSVLSLNRELYTYWQQTKSGIESKEHSHNPSDPTNLTDEDVFSGCSVTVVYIKGRELYSANIGDSMALISKNNGEHELITERHDPTNRKEFERIRLCGGFVSNDGKLDNVTEVSRSSGFLNLIPHINANPFIKTVTLGANDEMMVIANSELWEYVSFETAVDVINHNQSKKDPMWAAQKLRDYAISYGATDKLTVIVLGLNTKRIPDLKQSGSRLSISEDVLPIKKKKDRHFDSNLNRLENEISPPEGDLALVFTDIKNSTLLWDTFPMAMRSAIKTHNGIMRRQLRIFGGYEVKTEGDAFMVSFPTPISALNWCFSVQLQFLTADWPVEILESSQCCEITDSKNEVIYRGLSVRMGIHWGWPVCEPDIITGRMDYFGPMVNRASRISSVADGGQIAISADYLKQLIRMVDYHERVQKGESFKDVYGDPQVGKILDSQVEALKNFGYDVRELGERKLKGLETPEFISLMFPTKLAERINFMTIVDEKADSLSRNNSGILGGLISESNLYELKSYAIKLEHVCSISTAGTPIHFGVLGNSEESRESLKKHIVNPNMSSDHDYWLLLDNIITRIENATAIIKLNQMVTYANGRNGNISTCDSSSEEGRQIGIFDILEKINLDDIIKSLPKKSEIQ